MCDIGPGTILVCVEAAGPGAEGTSSELTEGAIYTCEDAHPTSLSDAFWNGFCECGELCLRVHIVGKPWCYCHTLFRPLIDGLPEIVENEVKEPDLV
jgi:hypothetical protein